MISNITTMERNDIHARINSLADKIKRLNGLLSNEGALHPVELELLHWYAREMKGSIEQLAAFKCDLETETAEAQAAPASVSPAPAEPVKEQVIAPPAVMIEAEEKPEIAGMEKNETAESMAAQVVEEITVKKEMIIARKTGDEKKAVSLNEKFKRETKALSDRLKGAKKKSIKELFELNERYKFIEDLFGGSAEQFNKTMNELGKVKDRSEAEVYIENIRSKYSWEKKQALAGRFSEQVLEFLG